MPIYGRGSRGNARGTPMGAKVVLAAGVHGLQGRRRRRVGGPDTLGECLPGARPARYFSINYPDFSPRYTLPWRSPPSRPHCTAHLPYKARCKIKQDLPMDPPCQWPPPLERRNMAPLANGPLLSKEETSPPPSDFFTKSHMNCPFLPSFLRVTLCVSCLILHLALLSQNLTIAVPQSR